MLGKKIKCEKTVSEYVQKCTKFLWLLPVYHLLGQQLLFLDD